MSLYHRIKRNIFPLPPGGPGYIPQFRLETRSRDADNEDSLAMRIADPLWMLGRQWQFGEFRAEDNGSPISVAANYRKEKARFYSSHNATLREPLEQVPFEQGPVEQIPLEARVEAMQVIPNDLRSRVRIGQKFEDLIQGAFTEDEASQFIQDLRTRFPLTKNEERLDEKSRRFFDLMVGNVIDGGKLWKSIKNNFPDENNRNDIKFMELVPVIGLLKSWYETLFLPPSSETAWQSNRLLHKFNIHHKEQAGSDDFTLFAPDYRSGHLDWYSFDRAEIGIDRNKNTEDKESMIPANVSFAAMPDNRLYAFEDSYMDFANMNVDKDDLVRLMLIDFSLVSGSDWYIIPMEMALGELCWVNHLKVTDVFGVTTIIKNDDGSGHFLSEDGLKTWDVFKIRDKNVGTFEARDHFLYLAPATTFRLESRPLEELLFLRDEFANMVWAIEKTVCNGLGKPTNGFDLHLELNGPFQKVEDKESGEEKNVPKFRLASPVPTNWIPYLPFHIDDSHTEIELRRALMMRNEDDNNPIDIMPLTNLANKDILTVREEAIPRAGVRVQLTKQRVRWIDGKTYTWLGRKVLAGRGEGSSGLKFDQLGQ